MKKTSPSPRGRPRSFDRTAALEKALELFWQWGYEGTSLAALTEAMGIAPPSLYAAFGSKEALFIEAVARYAATDGGLTERALEEPSARRALERLLEESAAVFTASHTRRGCLVICSAIHCAPASSSVQEALRARRLASEAALRRRIAQAIDEGELSREVNPASLAKHFASVIQGMSIQARDGASKEELLAVARLAMGAWPKARRRAPRSRPR